ncbi:NAD-dependent epimerase/dehydratase family protein [Pseudarthrobacter sp. AL20]|uniref:NAD-dependent epimerase/dehydratase family protein n=1 Tax=Pseudarthrobacter sp. AL20 TaxID=3042239 RepID=UPI00249C62B3|nr:NAD-dependent epimerase/dehydratase family protein [Pseudarthrobacter sp. AL20]
MANWVVVGASGFIGQGICEAVDSAGHRVTRLAAPRLRVHPSWSADELVESMSSCEDEIVALATRFPRDSVVVNAAGMAMPGASESSDLYGANAALPVLVLLAARKAGVSRFIHISSAAVQGRLPELDDTWNQQPFSAYSRSKALAESSLRLLLRHPDQTTDVRIIRATSIQDENRGTTKNLVRFARSPFASVAAPGDAPSPVSSLDGLAKFVLALGTDRIRVSEVSVQPWEGLTVRDVILEYGMKEPHQLPPSLCRFLVAAGYLIAKLGVPGIESSVRRAEVLWFGQSIRVDSCGHVPV